MRVGDRAEGSEEARLHLGGKEHRRLPVAEERVAGPQRDQLLKQVREGSQQAAAAFRGLRDFVAGTFFDDATKKDISGLKADFRSDRYAMGEEEYNWAVKNNLQVSKTAAQLYDEILFEGATFSDLLGKDGPVAIATGTDLSTGSRLAFFQGDFDLLCSDLNSVRLSRAAAP